MVAFILRLVEEIDDILNNDDAADAGGAPARNISIGGNRPSMPSDPTPIDI